MLEAIKRRRRQLAPLAAAMLTIIVAGGAAAYSGPGQRVGTTGVTAGASAGAATVIKNVEFVRPVGCNDDSCLVLMDIYVPAGTGPFPTVVLVRGGPTGPNGRWYVGPFAEQLAAAGMIVFNADYRDIGATGGGYPTAYEDVSCAVRFARANSSLYGGDGSTVTLVGHSLGGYVGSVVSLTPNEYQGDCDAVGDGRPDAFVGLSGNYDLASPSVAGDMVKFYGGSVSDTAAVRTLTDPYTLGATPQIPIRLVSGLSDTTVPSIVAEYFDDYLEAYSWDVELTLVPGGGHQTILNSDAYGAISVGVVLEATQAARNNAAGG